MFISVIICTYNRSESLKDTLECLLDQAAGSKLDYEVIIVDNNSNDTTKQVVESFTPKFGKKLRYFFEPKQGKPYALNLGIQEAAGDILAFTDDDCFLEKDYIAEIYKAFQEWGPDIGLVGGRISAKWIGGNPPEWLDLLEWHGPDKPERLDEFFLGPIGILNYGDKPFVLDYAKNKQCDKLFYGANMVIRRKALQQCGYFDVKKTLSQDSEICLRLLKGGVKGLYAPGLKVYHKIKTGKISFDFYYRWYALRGQYDTPDIPAEGKFFQPLGVPISMIRKTTTAFTKSCFRATPCQKTFYRSNAIYNIGQMIQIAKKNIFKEICAFYL